MKSDIIEYQISRARSSHFLDYFRSERIFVKSNDSVFHMYIADIV